MGFLAGWLTPEPVYLATETKGNGMDVGNEVLVRLRNGSDTRPFGSGWRVGMITETGFDILANEPMLKLDDGGPTIHASQIKFAAVLQVVIPENHDGIVGT